MTWKRGGPGALPGATGAETAFQEAVGNRIHVEYGGPAPVLQEKSNRFDPEALLNIARYWFGVGLADFVCAARLKPFMNAGSDRRHPPVPCISRRAGFARCGDESTRRLSI